MYQWGTLGLKYKLQCPEYQQWPSVFLVWVYLVYEYVTTDSLKHIAYTPCCFKLCLLVVLLLLLLLGVAGELISKQVVWTPYCIPGSGRPSRGIISRTSCTWRILRGCLNFTSRSPRFFSPVLPIFLGCEKRWTNTDTISSKYDKPQTGRCHSSFCCFWNVAVYKHAMQKVQYLVLSFTTTVGKSTETIPFTNPGFETWWFRIWLILDGW